MEEIKVARKQFSMLGWMFTIGTLIIYAVQLIPVWIIGRVKPEWLENPNSNLLIAIVPLYVLGMPLLIWLVRRIPAISLEKRDMKAGKFTIAAIMCFAIVYISNIVGNIATIIIGMLTGNPVQNVIANVATSVSPVLVTIYMVILAPFMEEYVFRKLIVDRTARYGQGVAVVVSGLMFGLFHGNLNQFVYAFTLGMFLAYLYVKTGKLKITIALHMMINFMGGLVSVYVIKLIDLEKYQEILMSGDMTAVVNYFTENIFGWMVYGIYILFIFGMMLAGAVLLIVALAKKRFTFAPGEVTLPKGKGFRTVILNPGMMVYALFWLVMIACQLFV